MRSIFGPGGPKHHRTRALEFRNCRYRCGHDATYRIKASAPARDAPSSTRPYAYQWFSEVAAPRRRGSGVRNQRGKSVSKSPLSTTPRLHASFTGDTQRPPEARPAEAHSAPISNWANSNRPLITSQPSELPEVVGVKVHTLRLDLWPTGGLIAHEKQRVSRRFIRKNATMQSTRGKLTGDE